MRAPHLLPWFRILAWATLLVSTACASHPKSAGSEKKRTVLLTRYDDERVGREASRDVFAQIGVLEDPELNAYVRRIGQKLLRGVPRRSFQYQFAVIDQSEPNAFALPGGYIFISRGLLALANTEDQLANVIGHEITHAAQRHAAAQQEIARRGGPLVMGWMRAGNLAAYGRDMERTADRGGQMLAAAAGYDPMGMSEFLKNLGQLESLSRGYARQQGFFDTHPGSRERAAANAARAREIRWKRDPALGDTHASHLRQIDGLPVGQRPEAGVFVDGRFIHPELGFQIRFPPDWRTSNTNEAVGAISPKGDAVIFLMADLPPGTLKEVVDGFVTKTREEQPITVKASQPVKIGRIAAWRMDLEGSSGGGSLTSIVTFIPYQEATWRVTGVSPSYAAKAYRGRMLSTTRSFRPLTEKEPLEATRIRVVSARPGEDLAALSQRTGNSWQPALTAVQNGLLPNHRFRGGELVKIARTEAYE